MQTRKQILAGVAAATAVLVAALWWRDLGRADVSISGGALPIEREASAGGGAALADPGDTTAAPNSDRVAVAAMVEAPDGAAPVVGDASTPVDDARALTRVVARIVDGAGTPLAGATLLAVYADGRPRGSAPSPPADETGVAMLELRDSELRGYQDQVFAMIFAVRADGYASLYPSVTPTRHGVTDLGTITLAPGGAVTGSAIDPAGAPIQGAIVLAVEPLVAGDLEELRVTGPDLDIPRPRASSDISGRFRIDGVALHETRLWLHAPGRLWTIDRALPVTAAGVTDAGPIVIEPAPPERRIAGHVRLPNGAPASGAVVSYQARSSFQEAEVTADAEGRFVIVPEARGEHELLARDPKGSWSPSERVTVPVGAPELTLVLRTKHTIAVHVTDPEGAPISGAALAPLIDLTAQYFVGGGRFPPGEDWTRTDEAGRADLGVPAEEFCVTASKAGYVGQRFGPYTPDSAPVSLSVSLRPEPVIAGIVECQGAPVAGVKIQIGQRLDDFVPREAGFPIRFFVNQDHGVRSGADGRFVCPVDGEWTDVTVLAVSDSHATGELELTLEPGRGARDVVVQVTHGGALEGSVLPPAGRDAEGLVVACSRGDGLPVWTRTDARGRYRLERLAPGPWRVEGRLEPPIAEVLSVAQTPEERDFGWNCEIEVGEVTRHDVDMRALGDVQLVGRFTLDGQPARGWTVALETPQEVLRRTALPVVELDGDGAFTLTAPAGEYALRVAGPLPGTLGVEVRYAVELAGARMDWSQGLSMGRLTETVEPGTPRVRLATGGVYTLLEPDREGRLDARVPAGAASLQHETEGPYGLGWSTLREVLVEGP